MANKVISIGEVVGGVFVIAGSITGNLAPMLAAVIDPGDLTPATSSSSSTSTNTDNVNPTQEVTSSDSGNIVDNIRAFSKNFVNSFIDLGKAYEDQFRRRN